MRTPSPSRGIPGTAGLLAAAVALLAGGLALAELRGHGGPVRALAVSPDGASLVSGSFDETVIRWSLPGNSAAAVLRFHAGAVNAIAMLADGRFASAGEDGRIAVWRPGAAAPATVLAGHSAPVAALAAAPDGARLASASWDRTVRLWTLDGGSARVLEGHQDNANGVAFLPGGRTLASVGYDATLRLWTLDGSDPPTVVTLPAPQNAVAVASDGEIVTAGADGVVRFLSPTGYARGEIEAGPTPIIALAVSPDGALVAASGVRGAVSVIDRRRRTVAGTLVGPGLPVWSLAFLPAGDILLTGGTDRVVRRWNARTGEHIGPVAPGAPADPLAAHAGDRGAEVFRACIACHTLAAADGERAGPTLQGIFGRRIGGLPGYNYSEALRGMDIVWTPETVARLFEIGPNAMTPGTKMPEQRIAAPEDREALVRFLSRIAR